MTPSSEDPTVCEECIERYYWEDGECKFVSLLCNNYNKQDGSCIDCIEGYLKIEGECKQPALGEDPHCIKYNSSAFCE